MNRPVAWRNCWGELQKVYPAWQVVLARELPKKFEEFLRGTPAALLAQVSQRALQGEFVVLAAGAEGTGEMPVPRRIEPV